MASTNSAATGPRFLDVVFMGVVASCKVRQKVQPLAS
jgi:hypothetical protein